MVNKLNITFLSILFYVILLSFCIFIPGESDIIENTDKGVIEITDMAGRVVNLDGPARRIMMLTPSMWHYLATEGSGEHILMLPKYMMREVSSSALGKIFPELLAKPLMKMDRLSSSPFNVEESMLVNADLILGWEHLSGKFLKSYVKGLVIIRFDGGDPTSVYEILADATQKHERVEWLWARHGQEMARVLEAVSGARQEKTLVILANENFSLWSGPFYRVFNDNIKKAGGINLGESLRPATAPINLENLLKLNPDIILINHLNLWQNSLRVNHIMDDARLQGLKAVINSQVYHMPMGAMRLEGPVEEPLFLIWIYQILHQDLDKRFNLRNEIKRSYEEVFNYQMTVEDIDIWLRYNENTNLSYKYIFSKN